MIVNILKIEYPKKVDYERIEQVRNRLENEGTTSEEKIKEIFKEIGVDINLESMSD